MQLLNSDKASHYMDSVNDPRQRSAILAIHLTWLEHSSPRCRSECMEPETPLDLLILYKAAAATFQDWPPLLPPKAEQMPNGHIINQQRATERLLSIADEETRLLASIFARNVLTLSATVISEQDLDYYVKLFLMCVCDKRVIHDIANGKISQHSAQLSDPDLW